MKTFQLTIVSLLLLLLTACGGDPASSSGGPSSWLVTPTGYEIKPRVDGMIGYFNPDPGYTWLLIHINVKNLKQEASSLSWFTNNFVYITNTNNKHPVALVYNSVPGYIDTYYQPQQQQSGFIAFEVPIGTNVTAGKLVFEPYRADPVTFDLTHLQTKN